MKTTERRFPDMLLVIAQTTHEFRQRQSSFGLRDFAAQFTVVGHLKIPGGAETVLVVSRVVWASGDENALLVAVRNRVTSCLARQGSIRS